MTHPAIRAVSVTRLRAQLVPARRVVGRWRDRLRARTAQRPELGALRQEIVQLRNELARTRAELEAEIELLHAELEARPTNLS